MSIQTISLHQSTKHTIEKSELVLAKAFDTHQPQQQGEENESTVRPFNTAYKS